MIFRDPRPIIVLFFSFFMVISCSEYQKLLKSDDFELKYEKALEYYEEEDYNKAIRLLSDVLPMYRGTQKAEEINYYFAMAHYKQGDYVMASHYFESFVSVYPRSEHAEEFLYLSAYCKYLRSPRHSLDQTVTREAIQEFQRFINTYPGSERVEEANELIDKLRLKLEKKRFENAKLYYNINDFQAAIRTFNNLISDFPGTEFEEEAMFFILRSYHDYAQMSIEQRKPERYENAVEAYNRLINNFPETGFMREANALLDNANDYLNSGEQPEDQDDMVTTETN